MELKRTCAPHCKLPDKRDFMDINPEKSAEDFYKNYDPMVGIGTAAILLSFVLLILIKSFGRYLLRRYRQIQYIRRATAAVAKSSIVEDGNNGEPSGGTVSLIPSNSQQTVKVGTYKDVNGELI
ncbi:hypothetical protein Ddc_07954 [Ditylenchus destructor]|nr:hypothetical protein Ddc_07954 [Ditylenchus destructor]